ncbi:MAG TPA: hypothetical protein VFY11_03565 [Nocardioidaceae bacterium]|nr:hypothetical protein [Nocardioidaceae bacterium]
MAGDETPGGVALFVVALLAFLAVAGAAATLDLFLALAALTLLAAVVFLAVLASVRSFGDSPVTRLVGVVLGTVATVLFLLSAASPLGLVAPVVAAVVAAALTRTRWFVAAATAVALAAAGAVLLR